MQEYNAPTLQHGNKVHVGFVLALKLTDNQKYSQEYL